MTGRPRSAVRAISATTGGAPGVRSGAAGTGACARQAERADASSANRATRDVVFNTVMSGTALSDVGHGLQPCTALSDVGHGLQAVPVEKRRASPKRGPSSYTDVQKR